MRGGKGKLQNDFDDYCESLLNKFKQDPQYELKQEFGKFLIRPIESLSEDELKRYNELKSIINP